MGSLLYEQICVKLITFLYFTITGVIAAPSCFRFSVFSLMKNRNAHESFAL